MPNTPKIDVRKLNCILGIGLVALALGAASCGKAKTNKEATLSAYGVNPENSAYEVQCVTQPPPAAPSGASAVDPMSIPIPTPLPIVTVPIDVGDCKAFGGEPPHFYHREMSAMTAIVDCNAKVVRFRTRDWQVAETSSISPLGNIDLNVMMITRLVSDADGNGNCWVRLLGHVTGIASCPGDPLAARLDFKVAWRLDESPPEVMEPAPQGQADLRNGKHCTLRPGNCAFTNAASVGCGG